MGIAKRFHMEVVEGRMGAARAARIVTKLMSPPKRQQDDQLLLFGKQSVISKKGSHMRHAIIVTETSGLFDYHKPADAPGQPRLAAFGYMTFAGGELEDTYRCYIKPDGWVMEPGATLANGLTTEFLAANGLEVEHALGEYAAVVEGGCLLVGYAVDFDTKIMRAELRRSGQDDLFDKTQVLSMIRVAKEPCQIQAKSGGLQFPKLHEACACFGIPWQAQMGLLDKLDTLNALFAALEVEVE